MRMLRRLVLWVSCTPAAALPSSWFQYGGGQTQQQQQQPVPVTGMTTGLDSGTGERPARWEVNALQDEGGPRWDLFIQGLAALQNKTEADERSHFSIAGIHGRPYAPYNGVGSVPGSPDTGFCPHGETQFVAWHRPYVALYEQVLGFEIQRIAAEYSHGESATAYRDAARTFRLPYWDWAARPRLPRACAPEHITVRGPRGLRTLRNPLYSYRWQTRPLNQTLFPGSEDWPPETTRASSSEDQTQSLDAVNANLARVAEQLKDLVYRTFTHATTYDQMSSMADPAGVSLEAPHNLIHDAVGGSFASLDITAFDSLFMLHHANLDRLAALWVAIHHHHANATHQSKSYATHGLYGTAAGENITAASPLKPFYQADGRTFHTGLTTAEVAPFGYSYAELEDWEQARGEEEGEEEGKRETEKTERARRGIVARVNALYGNSRSRCVDEKADLAAEKEEEEEEWFVQVAVDRSDLALPCNIDVSVGDNLVGRMALLAMPKQGLAHAEIPLQRVVVEELRLNTADRGAVEVTLREKLRVIIKGAGGARSDVGNVRSLELHLAAVTVTAQSRESKFPEYGERRIYAKIQLVS